MVFPIANLLAKARNPKKSFHSIGSRGFGVRWFTSISGQTVLPDQMKIVGLSGGIACGKSATSDFMQRMGLTVIDCDAIARDVVKKVSLSEENATAIF